MKFLDPRFRLIAILIDDPDESLTMRETALRHAKIVATECGFEFDEALRAAGITLASESPTDANAADASDAEPMEPDPAGGQIRAALQADPSRSDRDIGRECGASPTTVGKLRRALGLGNAARTVSRGGQTYDMAIGDRT